MAGKGASERTPLLASGDGQGTRSPYSSTTNADNQVSEAEATKHAQAEAERIKAQLPMSIVVPSLLSLWSCLFVSAVDGTLIISLVGPISSSFGASDQIFWLTTAYMLGMCVFSPIYGRTCGIVGRKACLFFAVFMFALGTTMCATASSMTMLIIARGIKGIGAGGIQPCVGVVLNDLIPLSKRGLIHSVGQVVFSTGNALGGPVGGLLADTFGWRFAFSIQIPPIALAVTLLSFSLRLPDLPKTPRQLREEEGAAGKPVLVRIRKRLDISGAVLLVVAVFSFLIAFTFVTVKGFAWTDYRVYSLLIVSALATSCFLYVEAYYAKEPLVPIRLLKKRTLAVTWLIFLLYSFASGVLHYFPLYFQTILEQTASQVGKHLLSLAVSTTSGSFFAGYMMKKTGRYYYLNIFGAIFALITPFYMATWSEVNRPSLFTQNAVTIPLGFGVALVFTILMVSPLAVVERHEQSQVIGLMYLFRNLGGIIGVSASGYIIQSVLQSELSKRITGPDATKRIDQIRRNINIVPSLPPAERRATKQSYAITLSTFHIVMGVIMAVCALLCAFVEERNLNDESTHGDAPVSNAGQPSDSGESSAGQTTH